MSPKMRAFLETAQRGEAPSSADRERVWRAVSGAAVLTPAPHVPGSPPAVGPRALGRSIQAAHAVAAGAVLFAAGVVVGHYLLPARPETREPAQQPRVELIVPDAGASASAAPALPPLPSVTAPTTAFVKSDPTARPSPPVAPPSTGGSGDEALTILRAKRELAAGRAPAALEALEQHERSYPHGALSEERDALRVLALCAAGRISEGREERTRFLRAQPISPYADRVRTACE